MVTLPAQKTKLLLAPQAFLLPSKKIYKLRDIAFCPSVSNCAGTGHFTASAQSELMAGMNGGSMWQPH